MDPRENLLRVYKELADWYEKQRQPPMRDRFLVLAADAALLANRPDEAESLRLRLLKVNPHHMLKPYASFTQALKAPDVLTYIKDLRVNYPANVAEDLLRTLQTDCKHLPAATPVPASLGSLGGPAASDELFLNSKEAHHDLAPTAPPAALAAAYPLCPDSRPQTLPLQAPLPRRPRNPMPAPLPFAADPAPIKRSEEKSSEGGSWLTVLLLLLVLASGAAVAAFTCLRPYLSMR